MAVANGASFFSRFTMKFVEVIGAGIATAVTGYLIAHLGGFWSTPRTPAATPASVEMGAGGERDAEERPRQPAAAAGCCGHRGSHRQAAKPPVKPDAVAEKEPAAAGTPPARATRRANRAPASRSPRTKATRAKGQRAEAARA